MKMLSYMTKQNFVAIMMEKVLGAISSTQVPGYAKDCWLDPTMFGIHSVAYSDVLITLIQSVIIIFLGLAYSLVSWTKKP
jgi:hypothetical protein